MTLPKYIMPELTMERHDLFFACGRVPLPAWNFNHQSAIGKRQSAIIAGFGCGHQAALCYILKHWAASSSA
jgi:hypothetical protein